MSNHVVNLRMHLFVRDMTLLGLFNYCICNGMWVVLFEASRNTQTLLFFCIAKSNNVYYGRCGVCQRPCLIKYYSICRCSRFEELASLYQR